MKTLVHMAVVFAVGFAVAFLLARGERSAGDSQDRFVTRISENGGTSAVVETDRRFAAFDRRLSLLSDDIEALREEVALVRDAVSHGPRPGLEETFETEQHVPAQEIVSQLFANVVDRARA